jgi:hypothetical protein
MEPMTAAVLDAVGLAHLVKVIERCRPTWNEPGIRHALTAALARHPYADVALVAIASARDPSAQTPAVIPTRCGNGWTGNDTTEPPTRTPPATPVCKRCGHFVTEPNHDEHCARRADPDHARAMRDQAKAAITKTTIIRNEEDP